MTTKTLWFCAALGVAGVWTTLPPGSDAAGAATILFDLGFNNTGGGATTDGPDTQGRYWNNLTDDTTSGQVLNAVDAANQATPIDLRITDGFVGPGAGGTSASAIYPASASKDYFYVAPGMSNYATIQFDDLQVGRTYDFTFYGSRVNATDSRITDFTIGSQTVSLQTANNVNDTVSLNGISPDANGRVSVKISAQSGQSAGHLGVVQISGPVPEPAGLCLIGLGGLALLRRRR